MDQEEVFIILRDNALVGGNKELMGAVGMYFDLSLRTQNLFSVLQKSIKEIRNEEVGIIEKVFSMLPESQNSLSEEKCKDIMEELKLFRTVAEYDFIFPFGVDTHFIFPFGVNEYPNLYVSHMELQSKFAILNKKLNKKIKYLKALIKVYSIATTLITGCGKFLFNLYGDRWFKSLGMYQAQKDIVEKMKLETFLASKQVETVKTLFHRSVEVLGRIIKSIEFGERNLNFYVLVMLMKQIGNQQSAFLQTLDDLEKHVYVCKMTISRARSIVGQKIIGHDPCLTVTHEIQKQ